MKRKNALFTLLLILIAVFAALTFEIGKDSGNYRVSQVADGDSFSLMKNRTEVRIRLYGIDCPERKQPFNREAEKFTRAMLQRGKIRFTKVDLDRYGRTVAWVFVGSLNLNEELVRHGLAWHYKHHSNDRNLARLEDSARAVKAGLWSDPHPVPPWEFRKRKGKY